jgi:hypothetical protein
MNRKNFLLLLGGAAVAVLYTALNGTGIFNRPRFASQHDAVARYLAHRYPGTTYDPIKLSGSGWSTILTDPDGKRSILYISRTEDGVYIFNEQPLPTV